jgi:hypothetical protein
MSEREGRGEGDIHWTILPNSVLPLSIRCILYRLFRFFRVIRYRTRSFQIGSSGFIENLIVGSGRGERVNVLQFGILPISRGDNDDDIRRTRSLF